MREKEYFYSILTQVINSTMYSHTGNGSLDNDIFFLPDIPPTVTHTFPDSLILCSVFKLDKPKRIGRIMKSKTGTKIHQSKVILIPSDESYHFHWWKKLTFNGQFQSQA